jgi:hypothetical protein
MNTADPLCRTRRLNDWRIPRPNDCQTFRQAVWLLLVPWIFWSAGCTPGQTVWKKPGASRFQMHQDREDCDRIAEAKARDASLFGQREIWGIRRPALEACMRSRGWHPGQPDGAADVSDRAEIVNAPPETALPRPPQDFVPASGHAPQAGTGIWQGPREQVLFVAMQVSPYGFRDVAPPVPRPLHVFDRLELEHNGLRIRLAVYFGEENNRPVGGISASILPVGGFLSHGPTRRTVVAVSLPLPPQKGSPPPGCLLDYGQRRELEKKARTWRAWIVRNLMRKD